MAPTGFALSDTPTPKYRRERSPTETSQSCTGGFRREHYDCRVEDEAFLVRDRWKRPRNSPRT
jgi:hypothetical protein